MESETHYSDGTSKAYHADWSLRKKYGISLEEYNELSAAQGHVCALCDGENPSGRRLVVDHDHDTGDIRALLCIKCNVWVGVIENLEFVTKASAYINQFKI